MANTILAPVRIRCWPDCGVRMVRAKARGGLALAGILTVLNLASAGRARAQAHKVPGLDKITSPSGPGQQEFNGKVQSLDLHNAVLNVQSLRENNIEIFPIKKGVRVTGADGGRLSLDSLEPGTNVLVYYEQKGDRRSVKGITVLTAAPAEPKNGEQKKDAKSGPPA